MTIFNSNNKKRLIKGNQPKSFLFATTDNKRKEHFQIESFDLNLWYINEHTTKVDIGLKIEIKNLDDFIPNSGNNLENYEIKIITPFKIAGEVNNYYHKLISPNILQLLFNASYKETIDISKEETNPNSDAKYIKFLSDNDNFVLTPFTIDKGTNDNQLLLKFSGTKYINKDKLIANLPTKPVEPKEFIFEYSNESEDKKSKLKLNAENLNIIKTALNSPNKQKNESNGCFLYFRFNFETKNALSDCIETIPLDFFRKQIYYDIRANEKRQDYTLFSNNDPADYIKIKQFRTFIILPNNYQLSTSSTSRATRYIRILEKNEWKEYLDHIETIDKTLFVYYWKYQFENPLYSSYSMIASYIGEHKQKIKATQKLFLLAFYILIFFVSYKFIILPLKDSFFDDEEFKKGFYVEFTSYLITSTISLLIAFVGFNKIIENKK
jgi:hypothetical protein